MYIKKKIHVNEYKQKNWNFFHYYEKVVEVTTKDGSTQKKKLRVSKDFILWVIVGDYS